MLLILYLMVVALVEIATEYLFLILLTSGSKICFSDIFKIYIFRFPIKIHLPPGVFLETCGLAKIFVFTLTWYEGTMIKMSYALLINNPK